MSTTGYTPTTGEVREAIEEWVWSRRMHRPELAFSDGLETDRWIAVQQSAQDAAQQHAEQAEEHDRRKQ